MFDFDVRSRDFGERFGETDGDTVITVWASSETRPVPTADELRTAMVGFDSIRGPIEGLSEPTFSGEVESIGCRATIGVLSSKLNLAADVVDREWTIDFTAREMDSPD